MARRQDWRLFGVTPLVLQRVLPVHYQRRWRRARSGCWSDDQKTVSIPRDVVRQPRIAGKSGGVEKPMRSPGLERRLRLHVHGHDFLVNGKIEQLLAIAAPSR